MSKKGPRGVELLQSETLVLAASAARVATAGTTGTEFTLNGERTAFSYLLEYTAKDNVVGDTCDVYIDMLVGASWINVVHFTQALGNGTDAEKQYALHNPPSGAAAPTVVTADAASGVCRPEVMGTALRARWVIVGAAASFTFAVTAIAY